MVIHIFSFLSFLFFSTCFIYIGRVVDKYHLQYHTKHQPDGVWVDCNEEIYPEMKYMVSECAPLVKHIFRVRAHNEMGWSDWCELKEGVLTLRRH